jgi:hypothetical protein
MQVRSAPIGPEQLRAPGQDRGQRNGEHRDPLHGFRMVERHPVRDAAAAVVSDHSEAREPERAMTAT